MKMYMPVWIYAASPTVLNYGRWYSERAPAEADLDTSLMLDDTTRGCVLVTGESFTGGSAVMTMPERAERYARALADH